MALSFKPSDATNPVKEGLAELNDYITASVGPGIDCVYTQPNSTGLFVSAANRQDKKEKRFQLVDLDATAPAPAELIDEAVCLRDLMERELPEPAALIQGLLHRGETVILAGRPKVGKSRLVQQMALSLVSGTDFIGHAVPNPVRVLMIDLENRPANLKKRFKMMGGAR